MVDIHSHILWGLDDGAETFEDSVEMIQMAADGGTTDIVATPHANHDYRFDPQVVEQRIAELQKAVGCGRIQIHYGCDFHLMFENIEDALREPKKYTINHGKYLMVEFADSVIPPNINDVFHNLRVSGIQSIITHPERNPALQRSPQRLEDFIQQGCFAQVTSQSLLGLFGKHAEQWGWKWMEQGLIHFVASDAHEVRRRTPGLKDAYDVVAKKMGAPRAEQLFIANPGAVIQSAPLPYRDFPVLKQKKWYQF
jgi:protein-tyrosine phosphatase